MIGRNRKETVTVSFITNHEVDPEQVDLRYNDPRKIRRELMGAADPCGNIQAVLDTDDESALEYKKRVREARDAE